MGLLVEGVWTDREIIVNNGNFVRERSEFSHPFELSWKTTDGATPRYWLIASKSCPWSHGATIIRTFHGLHAHIGLHVAHGPRVEGYAINGGAAWEVPGTGARIAHLHQLYSLSDPQFTGRSTVPVLWDAQRATIRSNDSLRIMRALNALGRDNGQDHFDLAPDALTDEIDDFNTWLYKGLNNAVYRAGFAESQDAYDAAVADVFSALDSLEERLSRQRYLLGAAITEADWRLFPTLVRFDAVYVTLHRCHRKRLTDYTALWAYARDLYAWPGIAETVDFDEILRGSYLNDTANNPHKIVPARPEADWNEPHARSELGPRYVHLRSGELVEANPEDRRA